MFVNGLDGWTFPEKYDKCSVSATIGRSNVENDPEKSSPLKPLGQIIRSLVGSIYGRSIKIAHFVPIR
jgi:hypothetical protein